MSNAVRMGGDNVLKNKFTDFGLAVKTELLKRGETQAEFIGKLKDETGLYIDDSYLNKILTGRLNSEKIVTSIKKILEIE